MCYRHNRVFIHIDHVDIVSIKCIFMYSHEAGVDVTSVVIQKMDFIPSIKQFMDENLRTP